MYTAGIERMICRLQLRRPRWQMNQVHTSDRFAIRQSLSSTHRLGSWWLGNLD